MRKHCVLHLTGGLGNQLFQFSAASSTLPTKLELEIGLGSPRGNSMGNPDISAFNFPFVFVSRKSIGIFNYMAKKATGFALRSAVSPVGLEKKRIVAKIIEISVSVVLLISTGRLNRVVRGYGTGYSVLPNIGGRTILIGYFQSHKFAESVYPELMKFQPKVIGPELAELIRIADQKTILVVHYRLGDYLYEDNFGTPGENYYINAITKLWDSNQFDVIWVFSDDIFLAKEKFPTKFLSHVRWIDEVDSSPASTLQAMRYGSGYVIANSTFSWWGAYLSMNQGSETIAPEPWFKGMESPLELIPPYWKTVNSDF